MSIVILPDAQLDLLSLQDYMLTRWTAELWLKAEDEIFNKLADLDGGLINGPAVAELVAVGIHDYRTLVTSHHRILYRQIDGTTYVYAVAGQQQDFQSLLLRRLLKR